MNPDLPNLYRFPEEKQEDLAEQRLTSRVGYLAWVYLGLLVVLSFIPTPGVQAGPTYTDKVFHLVGYFFFTYFFLLATDFHGRPFAWLLAAALAFFTESVQDLLPWREASLLDAAAGIAGATLAVVIPRRFGRWLLGAFSTVFFVGYLPKAPGTWATAITLAALYFAPLSPPVIFTLILPLALLAFWSADYAEKIWGHDPGKVVIDEALGAALAVTFLPKTGLIYILAFVLFRVVDIWKPPPVRQLDRMEGSASIVLDDIAGGIMVNIILWALIWFTPLENIGLRQIFEFMMK